MQQPLPKDLERRRFFPSEAESLLPARPLGKLQQIPQLTTLTPVKGNLLQPLTTMGSQQSLYSLQDRLLMHRQTPREGVQKQDLGKLPAIPTFANRFLSVQLMESYSHLCLFQNRYLLFHPQNRS